MNRQVADLLRSNGVDISKYDEAFLKKSLQKRMTEAGSGSMSEYYALLEQSGGERALLVDSLLISYSEFFRNKLTFAVLECIVLPSIVLKKKTSKHKELRIWSAACAGGQEAYSLAILLEELKSGDSAGFNYRIFATDQSEAQVNEARRGQFPATALNNVNFKRCGEWFTRQGEVFTVKTGLQKNIDFSTFDLFDENLGCPPESIFGDFDLVICANFLFYYKNEYRKIILGKANNSLAANGFIVTGEAERDIVVRSGFTEVFPQSAIFKRKMV